MGAAAKGTLLGGQRTMKMTGGVEGKVWGNEKDEGKKKQKMGTMAAEK